MDAADIHFYFDPVCPFCWLTSKWVRMVQAERDLSVEWRFISLRLINEHIDYDAHFPPEYEAGHTAGLRLLRVGEQSGQLGEMLLRTAAFYDDEITRWIERFSRAFEPVLMAAIGLVVGLIVILLYMPIFELAGSLR